MVGNINTGDIQANRALQNYQTQGAAFNAISSGLTIRTINLHRQPNYSDPIDPIDPVVTQAKVDKMYRHNEYKKYDDSYKKQNMRQKMFNNNRINQPDKNIKKYFRAKIKHEKTANRTK